MLRFSNLTHSWGGHFITGTAIILGLAACEPITPHGDLCGEARCKYIFKFYDKNHDGNLIFAEFSNMVKDILALKSDSETNFEEEAKKSAKIFGSNQCDALSMSDFLSGVGQLKFRGTSMLLRSPRSVLEVLAGKESWSYEPFTFSNSYIPTFLFYIFCLF